MEILFPLGNLGPNAAFTIDHIIYVAGRKWEIDQEVELEKIKYKYESQKFKILLETIAKAGGLKIIG